MGVLAESKGGNRWRAPVDGNPYNRCTAAVVACMAAAVVAVGCGGGSGGGASQSAPGPDLPGVSVFDASSTEGDAGDAIMVFSLSLSAPSRQPVTVGYSTVDESAIAGDDYSGVSGILGFAPGETTAEISVAVFGDTAVEADETIGLLLSDPQNAVISRGFANGFILNDDLPPAAPVGLDARPVNKTCVAPERNPAPKGVAAAPAFPQLPALNQPTAILMAPGDDSRWFALEKGGRIRVFDNDGEVADHRLWLDISQKVNSASEGGLLGMAFHPQWPVVPEIFLSYTGDPGGPMISYVSRFIVDDDGNTPVDWDEQVLLTVNQDFNNHNGGDLAFGPDGNLYFGVGDGGSANDPNERAQDTTRLLGSFLRIDVLDVGWPVPGYLIPADNPFSGNPKCGPDGNGLDCPEIYAWGFRNPWRFSFDLPTGDLWAGDVGQNSWEEVDIVNVGGNYGWDCREGAHDFEPANCPAAVLVEPVAEYSHDLGNSITGGVVYRGSAISGLGGHYVFGDFGSGRIFALDEDGQGGFIREELLDTPYNIVSFALDQGGEILILDFGGEILQLTVAAAGESDDVAELLSATGCADPADPWQPVEGQIGYDVNAAFWSDGASKRRYLAIPDGATIDVDARGEWQLPRGSVVTKHFELDGRPVETRLFMRHPDGNWAGYSYEWNDSGTDATRVRGGKQKVIDGQVWVYPGEAQCMECHTSAAGFTLGLEHVQQNGNVVYRASGRIGNQIATLDHIGMFSASQALAITAMPGLTDPADTGAPTQDRARAYLHTNCSQCHRESGPTPSGMDLRFDRPLAQTQTCDVVPEDGSLGIADARIIAPGAPARSVLRARMGRRDIDGMPPLGSTVIDIEGVDLIGNWIESLRDCR